MNRIKKKKSDWVFQPFPVPDKHVYQFPYMIDAKGKFLKRGRSIERHLWRKSKVLGVKASVLVKEHEDLIKKSWNWEQINPKKPNLTAFRIYQKYGYGRKRDLQK